MLVYLVALVQALVYLASVPVCAAFCLSTQDGIQIGVGLSAFERRFALRRARRFDAFPSKRRKRRGSGAGQRVWALLRRLRGLRLGLRGSLGLGDAAATALACGALRALGAALGPRVRRANIDILPDFSAGEVQIELQGMIRVSAGQIITAVAKNGIDDIGRRIGKWTDIRLKAS